jgi:hypothetical protein
MKKLYIYSIIAIIVIFGMSIIKGYENREGFQLSMSSIWSKINKWFHTQWFVIPAIMTLFVGPIIYYVYLNVLRNINKSITAVANAPVVE